VARLWIPSPYAGVALQGKSGQPLEGFRPTGVARVRQKSLDCADVPSVPASLHLAAADTFSKIRQTMPADNPGTLHPQETVDLLAVMFSRAGWPDGETELPGDLETLKQIQIQP
jgi:hypothetical protein